MKLNCKAGDLAVIVRSCDRPDAVGKIVRCVKFDPHPDYGAAWRVEPSVGPDVFARGLTRPGDWWIDHSLRPIRDSDGEDEMLRIAGIPNKAKETT